MSQHSSQDRSFLQHSSSIFTVSFRCACRSCQFLGSLRTLRRGWVAPPFMRSREFTIKGSSSEITKKIMISVVDTRKATRRRMITGEKTMPRCNLPLKGNVGPRTTWSTVPYRKNGFFGLLSVLFTSYLYFIICLTGHISVILYQTTDV